MNPERLGWAAGLAFLVFIARPALPADDDGFKPLFNGKDLGGWVTPDDKAIFNVVDGAIAGKEGQPGQLKMNEFLVTDRDYGDFVLKAKVQIPSGNSGIQFRSKHEPNGRIVVPQVDIDGGCRSVLYDEGGKRGIMERYPPQKNAALVNQGRGMERSGRHVEGRPSDRCAGRDRDPGPGRPAFFQIERRRASVPRLAEADGGQVQEPGDQGRRRALRTENPERAGKSERLAVPLALDGSGLRLCSVGFRLGENQKIRKTRLD